MNNSTLKRGLIKSSLHICFSLSSLMMLKLLKMAKTGGSLLTGSRLTDWMDNPNEHSESCEK